MTATDESTTATGTTAAADAGPPAARLSALLTGSRRLVGCPATDVPAGVQVADWLNVSRVVEATGDENPLYLDVVHGARSWWRTTVAPPAFVLAVRVPESVGAFADGRYDGVDLLSRVELWWDDHIRLGDRVGADLRVTGAGLGPVWRGRDTVEVTSRAVYRSEGRRVAEATGTVRVHPLRLGDELVVEREMHRYSTDEIDRIAAGLDAEPTPRGTRPRFADEVAVGDRLPELVRGPVTWSELISWTIAEGRPFPAGNLHHRALVTRPGSFRPDPVTGWPVADRRFARESLQACADAGFPAPCARGPMVVALAAQLVTTWMGDDAFLRNLTTTLDAPVLYGDTVWLSGEVADTFTQRFGDREYAAASVEVRGVNQLGQRVLRSTGLVFLPRPGRPVLLPVEEEGRS